MYTELEIKDNLELCLETVSGIINATGTTEQKKTLAVLKENINSMFTANPESYITLAHETMELVSCKEFAADFIIDEINTLKFNISSLTTIKLKEALESAKAVLGETKEDVVESIIEPEVNPEVAKMIEEEIEKEINLNKEEEKEMKTKNEEVKQEKTTGAEKAKEEKRETEQEKTIRELKEKLEKARDKANKCKTSTIAKVGKVTLGLGLLGAAAAGGYYAAKKYGGSTTIILNNSDEE